MTTPIVELPTSLELARAEQVLLPTLTADDPIFQLFPFEGKREYDIRWVQKDNYAGLQQVRGLGGKPGRVFAVGEKSYLASPGVYGEFEALEERELTMRRDAAMLSGGPVSARDLVAEKQVQLLNRRMMRIRQILWALVTTGTFSSADGTGVVLHTDSYTQTTFTASVVWSDHANSTPLADLKASLLLYRGQSVRRDSSATLYLNQKWANHLTLNTNPADLGGKRILGGSTLNTLADINRIFLDNNLPQVRVMDDGYFTEASPGDGTSTGTFQLFIPDSVGVLVANRTTGARIGSFRFVLNINTPGMAPAPYTRVIDKSEREIPASIEVHDGFSGGPTLEFPGTIVKFNI